MSTFFAVLWFLAWVDALIFLVVLLIKKISKKETKRSFTVFLLFAVGGLIFFVLSLLTSPSTWCEHQYRLVEEKAATCTVDGEITYHCDLCDTPKVETIEAEGHSMVEVSRTNPTENAEGFEISKCEVCGFEETKILEKIASKKTTGKETTTQQQTQPVVSFEEIYSEYELNEVRADEKYKGNRYVITATVNGINNGGGLLNFDESINITLEKRVGNTIVFFYASFDKSQKDSLVNINVGDEITFEGTCYSAGSWSDCVLK